MSFSLHPQLKKDTLPVGDLPLCRVLLMNNRQFPWLILVPRRSGKRELFDLDPDDYKCVMNEVRAVAASCSKLLQADKINIAALGNQVPQLHIHVIARYASDPAWPNPVWNSSIASEVYDPTPAALLVDKIRKALMLG